MRNDTLKKLAAYLGCDPDDYYPSGKYPERARALYQEVRERGEREGFFPVFVVADDDELLETLERNLKKVGGTKAYRRAMLSTPLKDEAAMKVYFSSLLDTRKEDAEEFLLDWEEEIVGVQEGGRVKDCPYCPDVFGVFLAEIPARNPWEIFAWLPFGGWNDCPDTPDLMAAGKYWYEKYGAVPMMVSHDELQFVVPRPVPPEEAMELAMEQYAFCPGVVEEVFNTIGALADTLSKSTYWYLTWD